MPGYVTNPGDHIDAPLSNYLAAYRPIGGIADNVCPVVPVRRRSDKFYIWDKAAFLRDGDDARRARGTRPRVIEPTESLDGYLCVEYELSTLIEDSDIPNTDSVLRLEMAKVGYVADILRIQREVRVANLLDKVANGGSIPNASSAGPGTAWSTVATATVIADITTGVEFIRQRTGYKPNTLVIPAYVAQFLPQVASIQTLIQYIAGSQLLLHNQVPLGGASDSGSADGAPNQAGPDFHYLPQTFLGMRVLEPGMVHNTAAEGAAFTQGDIWGKHVRILYVTPSTPMMEIPSAAYTFRSTEYGTAGWNVRRWREEGARSNFYGVGIVDTEKLVATDLCYEIVTAAA